MVSGRRPRSVVTSIALSSERREAHSLSMRLRPVQLYLHPGARHHPFCDIWSQYFLSGLFCIDRNQYIAKCSSIKLSSYLSEIPTLRRGLSNIPETAYSILEVRGPSGPQLLFGGPSGWLDFVFRALWALRPRLTHQG